MRTPPHETNTSNPIDFPKYDSKKVETAVKPDIVEIIRFFRIRDYRLPINANGQYPIASFGGMTGICMLDYVKNIITVYPAFCREEENFEKKEGIYWASVNQAANLGFFLPFDKTVSIRDNIINEYHKGNVQGTSPEASKRFAEHLHNWVWMQ